MIIHLSQCLLFIYKRLAYLEMWWIVQIMQKMVISACGLSMVSICCNTPSTIAWIPALRYLLFGIDLVVTILFTIEAAVKMARRGVYFKSERSYFRDKWCCFDFVMLFSHWLSLMEHVLFVIDHFIYLDAHVYHKEWFSIFQSGRPLITIRFLRSVVHFQLPKNRIAQIFKRSSQQISNVTIFFTFFMSLYGILGVQLFGRMDYHCVRPGTDINNVTKDDLALPDRYCNRNVPDNHQCPQNLICKKVVVSAREEGYYGMFNNFVNSIFTVYMAASQEGWVYVMYDCIDSFNSTTAFLYFITLIFFLAWLVKNVFIAVITETFAEIRVQFSTFWATREVSQDNDFLQMLEMGENGKWRLVSVDRNVPAGVAPEIFKKLHRSTTFQVMVMLAILSNAIISATLVHTHNKERDDENLKKYYRIEVAYVILFNLECVFKVMCLGFKGFLERGPHKFEFCLVIGSTINVATFELYRQNWFTYFQVFRILRLIKASPMLEDFVYKIFGPGKKLGGLIMFTIVLLVITSAISLQLFCFIKDLRMFESFPWAFMSMFQILTQEGWTEIVVDVMRKVDTPLAPLVAFYFLVYHLFVTLIVLSLFVAVILDNLEMDEELKKVKQLKAREQTTSMRSQLPLRPQMVEMRKVTSEFPVPKVRQSFARQFTDDFSDDADDSRDAGSTIILHGAHTRIKQRLYKRIRHSGQNAEKNNVDGIVEYPAAIQHAGPESPPYRTPPGPRATGKWTRID